MEVEFRAVWEAAERSLTSEATPAFWQLVMGGLARRHDAPRTYADLHSWLIPGLKAFGIQSELLPLAAHNTPHGTPLSTIFRPLFAFSEPIQPFSSEEDPLPGTMPIEIPEPILTHQGLWLRPAKTSTSLLHWRETDGTEEAGTWETLQRRYSHYLLMHKSARKGLRRDHIQAACMRWLAYSDAYPGRIPTNSQQDAPQVALSASFLNSVAGKQRDRASNRLRWAAEAYEHGEVAQGIELLRMAVLHTLGLPAALQAALLSDPIRFSLSEIERRELIYLARAGTRDLKVLAARRLTAEQRYSDVRNTLIQLRYDPDPWVRTASQF